MKKHLQTPFSPVSLSVLCEVWGFFASDFNRKYLKREECNMLKTLFHPLTLHTFASHKIGFYTSVQAPSSSDCEFQLQFFTLNQFFHYC